MSRRSSSSVSALEPLASSGTMRSASFSSTDESGRSSAVQRILNTEWATAMPNMLADCERITGAATIRTKQNTESHTTVPMMLKRR